MAGKNINNSTLQKVTDFTNVLNRLYASATSSTKDGYIILKELIDYIISQGSGGGDMTKAVYDTDDSGVVDDSELIAGDTVANNLAVQANTAKVSYTDAAVVALNTAKKTSLWQILTNKLSNILQSVDYVSLFAGGNEIVRIGDGAALRIYDSGGGYIFLLHTESGNFGSLQTQGYLKIQSGTYTIFEILTDISSGNAFTFRGNISTRELTDTNGEQSWMSLQANIKQTGTGAYNALKIDVNETSLGDGSTGDGNNILNLAVGGVSKFRIDNAGNVIINVIKSGATQVAAGASAGEMWKTSGHSTLPDNVIMHGV